MGNPDFFFKDPMLWMSQKQRKEIAVGGQVFGLKSNLYNLNHNFELSL
jgi:hypothetical protein